LKKANLKEAASAPISSRDLAVDLLADYGTLVAGLRSGLAAAQDAGDEVSVDRMLGSLSEYEKIIWMLDAYLQ
jgi:starvation-inducible DNA-binding protein